MKNTYKLLFIIMIGILSLGTLNLSNVYAATDNNDGVEGTETQTENNDEEDITTDDEEDITTDEEEDTADEEEDATDEEDTTDEEEAADEEDTTDEEEDATDEEEDTTEEEDAANEEEEDTADNEEDTADEENTTEEEDTAGNEEEIVKSNVIKNADKNYLLEIYKAEGKEEKEILNKLGIKDKEILKTKKVYVLQYTLSGNLFTNNVDSNKIDKNVNIIISNQYFSGNKETIEELDEINIDNSLKEKINKYLSKSLLKKITVNKVDNDGNESKVNVDEITIIDYNDGENLEFKEKYLLDNNVGLLNKNVFIKGLKDVGDNNVVIKEYIVVDDNNSDNADNLLLDVNEENLTGENLNKTLLADMWKNNIAFSTIKVVDKIDPGMNKEDLSIPALKDYYFDKVVKKPLVKVKKVEKEIKNNNTGINDYLPLLILLSIILLVSNKVMNRKTK